MLILPFAKSLRLSPAAFRVLTLLTRDAEAYFGDRFEPGRSDIGLTTFTTPVRTSVETAQRGIDRDQACYRVRVERGPDTPVNAGGNVFCLTGSGRRRCRYLIETRSGLREEFGSISLEAFPDCEPQVRRR